jgi:cell division protein FtsB
MSAIEETDDTLTQSRGRFGASRWWLATAATLFFALWGWRELGIRAAREKVASRDAEIRQLTEQNAVLTQRIEKLTAEMTALGSSETRTIALAGQHVAPAASARVFLQQANRRAVVFFQRLPVNPHDKSYQLWIIRADPAKPQSAGVFDVSPAGAATISVENLPAATEIKALAVTMEPRGGVQQPTNTKFYLMGKM